MSRLRQDRRMLDEVDFQEFHELLRDAFDLVSFDQMLQIRLGVRLYDIANPDAFFRISYLVIKESDESSWSRELLQAACAERPNHPGLRDFAQKFKLEPLTHDLSEEMRGQIAVAMNRTVNAYFKRWELIRNAKASLEATLQQFARATRYKETHDLLQQLEVTYQPVHDTIYDGAQLLAGREIRWVSLCTSCSTLQMMINKLNSYVGANFRGDNTVSWSKELNEAAQKLTNGCQGKQLDDIAIALDFISVIISQQPSNINGRLMAAIDILNLPTLLEKLDSLCQELNATVTGETPETAESKEISDLIKSYAETATRLGALRVEHNEWQQLDNLLRSESDFLTGDLSRFTRHWSNILKIEISRRYQNSREQWGPLLDSFVKEIDQTLTTRSAAGEMKAHMEKLAAAFSGCRNLVLQLFNQIDINLKRVFGDADECGSDLLSKLANL